MELLEGESLHERSQREPPLTERDLLEVANGVPGVLEAAHANGVASRSKPDNLFLVKNEDRPEKNEIKVLDFGLARLLEKQEQSWNGVAFGTPTYMSPSRLREGGGHRRPHRHLRARRHPSSFHQPAHPRRGAHARPRRPHGDDARAEDPDRRAGDL